MKKYVTEVIGCEEHADGSATYDFRFSKAQANDLYRLAIKDGSITLKDLVYQQENSTTRSFKKLVVAAYLLNCFKKALKEGTFNENNSENV